MRSFPSIAACVVVLALAAAPRARAEEAGPSAEEIRAIETRALDAFRKKDYRGVLRVLRSLKEKGVDLMGRTSGRYLLEKTLNAVLNLDDGKERLAVMEAFLGFDYGVPERWRLIVRHARTRDACREGVALDKVVAQALALLEEHDAKTEAESDPAKKRVLRLERTRYLDLLALAYHVNGLYDSDENRLVDRSGFARRFSDASERFSLDPEEAALRVVVADFNEDGKEDFLVDGRSLWFADEKGYVRAGEVGREGNHAALAADLDNDGDADILQIGPKGDCVLLNDGSGLFAEKADAGVSAAEGFYTTGATLLDADADGLLDIYLVQYKNIKGPDGAVAHDRLFLGKGKAAFALAQGAGIDGAEARQGWCAATADYDGDGDTDILVGNCNFHLDANYLWRNDGKGAFSDQGAASGALGRPTEYKGRTYHGHTFAVAFGDADGDARPDVFLGNLCRPEHVAILAPSAFLRNRGPEGDFAFEDRTVPSKVRFAESVSDCSFADYDNDGDLDLFLSCPDTRGYVGRTFLYRNDGDGVFEDMTWQTRTLFFGCYGHAWFDQDGDGDLDLVLGTQKGVRVLLNGQHKRNSWMKCKLFARDSNYSALGTTLRVRAGGVVRLREVRAGHGPCCQDSAVVHVGLGRHKGQVKVEVRWPSGKVQNLSLDPNRLHVIREP